MCSNWSTGAMTSNGCARDVVRIDAAATALLSHTPKEQYYLIYLLKTISGLIKCF